MGQPLTAGGDTDRQKLVIEAKKERPPCALCGKRIKKGDPYYIRKDIPYLDRRFIRCIDHPVTKWEYGDTPIACWYLEMKDMIKDFKSAEDGDIAAAFLSRAVEIVSDRQQVYLLNSKLQKPSEKQLVVEMEDWIAKTSILVMLLEAIGAEATSGDPEYQRKLEELRALYEDPPKRILWQGYPN